jgi:electron transfer flavoprotein alpha subunit
MRWRPPMRVLKFNLDALAYPNAEVVRKLLVNVLPADAIVLISNDTFGMDLGPGLSIKLDSTFVADVVGIEGVDGGL